MTVAIGLGRRKSAVARVRLLRGEGKFTVNGRPVDEYFLSIRERTAVRAALVATKSAGKYDVWVRVDGGGMTGQAGATRLGIAKALRNLSQDNRGVLRAGGLLTTDAREKERRKYGHAKARKSFQFSKR
ncbi:MAG: 30S ribosomal protein S9 [Planctomycetes bacterium]|nr:30S ribosomal protein S9 [Planctomycetota bacterium]